MTARPDATLGADEHSMFEAHIENTAWHSVLSLAKNDDDEGASMFRLARMAAQESWFARAALAEPAEDALRRALEMIAVGGSSDPVRDAGDELVALGHWSAEALAQHRAATPVGPDAVEARDGERYRCFFEAGLPITFLGREYSTKRELDDAIDAALASTKPSKGAA